MCIPLAFFWRWVKFFRLFRVLPLSSKSDSCHHKKEVAEEKKLFLSLGMREYFSPPDYCHQCLLLSRWERLGRWLLFSCKVNEKKMFRIEWVNASPLSWKKENDGEMILSVNSIRLPLVPVLNKSSNNFISFSSQPRMVIHVCEWSIELHVLSIHIECVSLSQKGV